MYSLIFVTLWVDYVSLRILRACDIITVHVKNFCLETYPLSSFIALWFVFVILSILITVNF